jgi:small subunit ribosomal protein S2
MQPYTIGGPLVTPVSMKQLLEAGVHFGHQTRRWNPKMRHFIFTERNGIHIIDLQQTVTRLDEAINFIRDTVAMGNEVLVIGTKKQARETVEMEAERANMPFVNNRWLGGTLTNFRTIQGRIKHLHSLEGSVARGEFSRLTKKEQLDINNEIERLNRYFGGIKHMERLPAAVFVIDTVKEAIAVAECDRLGIPIVSLVDTNCDPDPITYPIPSNDDAIRAIKLILGKVADAAIEGRAARESGVGPGVHGDDLARMAEQGVATGEYSASPDEEAAQEGGASVTVISSAQQAAAAVPTPAAPAEAEAAPEPPPAAPEPAAAAPEQPAPAAPEPPPAATEPAPAPSTESTQE